MNLKKIFAAASLICMASAANATIIEAGSETSLQQILNNITVNGDSSIDVNNDQVDPDRIWTNTDSGISPSTFIIEIAGNAGSNTFGIYDQNNTNNFYQLYAGADTTGDTAIFSVLDDGSVLVGVGTALENGFDPANIMSSLVGDLIDTGLDFSTGNFGFFMGNSNGPMFFSDEEQNAGGVDQMVAFRGVGDLISIGGQERTWTQGGWVLAWEDSMANSDRDFNDMVLLVESIMPVSAPGTIGLLGAVLVGLRLTRRKN